MRKIIYLFAFAILFSISLNANAQTLKNNGATCSRSSECRSGSCVEGYLGLVCAGPKNEGQTCSITDPRQGCAAGLYCQGDTFVCVADERTGSNGVDPNGLIIEKTGGSGSGVTGSTGAKKGCGPTEFCNPLAFSTIEEFLSYVLSYLQKIIVILALVFMLIGAIMYITSAGDSGQITKAKSTITASLIGLAIGIAAPSFLKEIAIILGLTSVGNAQVAGALTLTEIAMRVVNFLLSVMGILALVMMVIGAIYYLTAAGDEAQIKKGKSIFQYSVLGVIMALSSMVIIKQIALLLAR